jgi:hypothetical protein
MEFGSVFKRVEVIDNAVVAERVSSAQRVRGRGHDLESPKLGSVHELVFKPCMWRRWTSLAREGRSGIGSSGCPSR